MPWYWNWEGFWKHLLEVVGVLGLAFYCCVTYEQWSDLRHNFEADERSWVAPSFTWNSDKVFVDGDALIPGKMFDGDAVVRITNAGKSPILKTQTNVWVQILDHETAPSFDWQTPHTWTDGGMIFPGRYIDTENHRLHLDGTHSDPTDAELKALRETTDYVVAYGYTMYLDKFGSHWVRFCTRWSYTGKGAPTSIGYNALSCVSLNATGDGDNALADITPKN